MPPIDRCDLSLVPSAMPADLSRAVVVAIDVLRATTTIACALQSGARSIIPCAEPADAIAVRERMRDYHVLLGGERGSVRIPGFDIDNSPLSCTREAVAGKVLAFTTTNGTRTLRRAIQAGAREILCAAFVNLDAVAAKFTEIDASTVLLACAGDEGAIALEDLLLAGALVERLRAKGIAGDFDDGAKAAALAYRGASGDLQAAIASGKHAQALVHAGFADDVAFAAQLDAVSVVPVLRGEEIRVW